MQGLGFVQLMFCALCSQAWHEVGMYIGAWVLVFPVYHRQSDGLVNKASPPTRTHPFLHRGFNIPSRNIYCCSRIEIYVTTYMQNNVVLCLSSYIFHRRKWSILWADNCPGENKNKSDVKSLNTSRATTLQIESL